MLHQFFELCAARIGVKPNRSLPAHPRNTKVRTRGVPSSPWWQLQPTRGRLSSFPFAELWSRASRAARESLLEDTVKLPETVMVLE